MLSKGLAEGCREAGCALIGGETAEMPGLYADGDYDLAGCIVGIVERDRIIDGSRRAGRAIRSSAWHRAACTPTATRLPATFCWTATTPLPLDEFIPGLGRTLGEELLAPHRCYAPAVLPLLDEFDIHGMAHLTGGGFYENIPRILPSDCSVTIERRNWPIPPIFSLIQERGNVPEPGNVPHVQHGHRLRADRSARAGPPPRPSPERSGRIRLHHRRRNRGAGMR